jgi:hypothetical protein
VAASVTIIVIPADAPDSFEELGVSQRKQNSLGWVHFPIRSGRYIDTFFLKATDSDLGVLQCAERTDDDDQKLETNLIDRSTILKMLPKLGTLVEERAKQTAAALVAHAGGKGDVARVAKALKTGDWPKTNSPAEEAAAFAHHLLVSGRTAKARKVGVCWEFRGKLKL